MQKLQRRSGTAQDKNTLNTGDLVFEKDENVPHNEWPLGQITKALNSEEVKVRKAQVELMKEG